MTFSPCIIIPVFNHPDTIESTYEAIKPLGLPCFIVDDGSDEHTRQVLIDLAAREPAIQLSRLLVNQGKGGAVMQGLTLAFEQGYSHGLQIDADGQHDIGDIPTLLELAEKSPQALVCGQPEYDQSVPKGRLFARYISHFWVCVETLNMSAPDSMCGFRVYPLAVTHQLIQSQHLGQRMDFDTEVLVRLIWQGVDVVRHGTRVIYPEDGRSHFNYVADNWLISKMHTRLFFGMLYRLPTLLRSQQSASQHWSEMRERGSIWGIRFLLSIYKLFGRRVFQIFLYPVLAYFMVANKSARAASMDYLNRVYTIGSDRLPTPPTLLNSYQHFIQFGHSALDRVASLLGHIKREQVDFPGRDEFLALIESGTGGVVIGSHLGNIELTRVLAKGSVQKKMTVLVFNEHAENFNRTMKKVNTDFDNSLLHIDHVGPETAILLKEKIDAGELIVILGDRTPVNSETRISYVDFLGDQAPFPQGPFILASLLSCPVYLMFCLRENRGYRVYFEKFSDRVTLNRKQRDQDLSVLIQGYARRLEHFCLKQPLQWFNFFDFWQHGEKQTKRDSYDQA